MTRYVGPWVVKVRKFSPWTWEAAITYDRKPGSTVVKASTRRGVLRAARAYITEQNRQRELMWQVVNMREVFDE